MARFLAPCGCAHCDSPRMHIHARKKAFGTSCASMQAGLFHSSPSQSSKVSPPHRMPTTAARQLKQFPCPASRAATLSWPPSPPLALRLPALRVRHSRARDARPVPGSARDNARSPSAIYHDIACPNGIRNSPNSPFALTHTGRRTLNLTFLGTRGCARTTPSSAPGVGFFAFLVKQLNRRLRPRKYAPALTPLGPQSLLLEASPCPESLSVCRLATSPAPGPYPHACQLMHHAHLSPW